MSVGYQLLGRIARVPVQINNNNSSAGLDFVHIMKAARSAADVLYQITDSKAADYKKIITNIYKRSIMEAIAMAARISPSKAYLDNVGRTGHCFSADNLINIHDASVSGALKSGDKVMLLGAGVSNWSACAVQAVL